MVPISCYHIPTAPVPIVHIIGSITTMDIALYLSMLYLEPDDASYFQGSFIFPVLFSYLWKFAVAVKYGKSL